MIPNLVKRISKSTLLSLLICVFFFTAFSTLSIVRHQNFNSFGYDLGINDQTVWRYSTFQAPISTISPYPDKPKLFLHFELIYPLLAPFYWIYDSPITLLLLENIFLVSGGFALFLLARKRLKNTFLSFSILISYLMFFGVQFSAWTDAHSTSFASAFIAWFLYFTDTKKLKYALVFLLLAITSKENIGLYTFLISLVYAYKMRQKKLLYFAGISIIYLLAIFVLFFPSVTDSKYLYQNSNGLLSNLNPYFLINTPQKVNTLLFSYGATGFLALLNPFSLLLTLSHFFTFFVLASDLPGGKDIYGHYRATATPLLFWGAILTVQKFKILNKNYIAVYLLICTFFLQYYLHLPLSYLAKSWFWERPEATHNINKIIKLLPGNTSVAAQNNITPHIAHRDKVYTIYPITKNDKPYLEWFGDAKYLLVDTSANWDTRHLLTDNSSFRLAISNLENEGKIKLIKKEGNSMLFVIVADK